MTRRRVASAGMTCFPVGHKPGVEPMWVCPVPLDARTGHTEGASCRPGDAGTMKGQGVCHGSPRTPSSLLLPWNS